MFFHHTVLLADDQSACREELREIVRHFGMSVVAEASNTDDALARFEKLDPDVVVIDVTLLGSMDALVAIKQMRRLNPQAQIYATGAASQASIVMESLTMGAVDFILKPFKLRAVRSALERTL